MNIACGFDIILQVSDKLWQTPPVVLTGPRAIGICEPCQVRKEAAISGNSYVPQVNLAGTTDGVCFICIVFISKECRKHGK